jgi:Skp family chaperone for outer membrane proteins
MSMKRITVAGGLGAMILFLGGWAIFAQDSSKLAPRPTKIALIDVNSVIKQSKSHTQQMKALKKDADEFDEKMKEQQGLIAMMASPLKDLQKGTPEYAEIEEKVTRAAAQANLGAQRKKRDMVERESKTYLLTYLDLNDAVEKNAHENQIDIVLRFTGDPVDSNNPESILAGINRPIIWYDKNLDMTPAIHKVFEEKEKNLDTTEKTN